MQNFEQILKDTTHGTTILLKFPYNRFGTIIVVLKNGDKYDINRYFTLNGIWHVGYDLRNLTEEQAWKEVGIYIEFIDKN